MFKKSILFLFLISLLFCNIAYSQHLHQYFTGDLIKVSWSASENATGYEWYIGRISDGAVVLQDTTVSTSINFQIQSAGIYVVYARSYLITSGGTTLYSIYTNSLTHGIVDELPHPWQIKVKIKPVGDLIFTFD